MSGYCSGMEMVEDRRGGNAPPPIPIWRLSDGRAGHDRQAAALAAQLGGGEVVLAVAWPLPWRWAAPHRLPGLDRLCREWPEPAVRTLIVGCGRRAALANRWLKHRYGRRVFTVQILDPRSARGEFDLIIAPAHDALSGPNVVQITGSLHPVSGDWLTSARRQWSILAAYPVPRIVVLWGGMPLSRDLQKALTTALDRRLQAGGSLLCAASRRTRPRTVKILAGLIGERRGCFHDAGQNSYPGLLAYASEIWVTADSVNMISEALATGRPVRIVGDARRRRQRRFIGDMREAGWIGGLVDGSAAVATPVPEMMAGVIAEITNRYHQSSDPR